MASTIPASLAGRHFTLATRLRRSVIDMIKYTRPGVGRALLKADEEALGIDGRLPEHYRDFHRLWSKKPQEFIHIRPRTERYEKDEFGEIQPVQVANVLVFYPNEFHHGLWGGEGVIRGLKEPPPQKHKPNYKSPLTWYWFPRLHSTVVYSETLDAHISLTATERGETLIDRHKGLDFYLLETPVNEVYATRLLRLKREILLRLARPDERLFPDDPQRRRRILDKYGRFAIDEEEADWHGLSIFEAREKQLWLEQKHLREEVQVPLKHEFRKELFELLKKGYLDDVDVAALEEAKKSSLGDALSSLSKKIGLK